MFCSSTRWTHLALACGLALVLLYSLVIGLERAQARSRVTTYTVTNTNDSGAGSLRQAILNANANAGSDTINVTAIGTVDLLSALPIIADPLAIQGSGSDLFKIDGQDLYRVFDIAGVNVTLSDLTVQRGNTTAASEAGAGIRSNRALTLSHVNVMSNTAYGEGGGVSVAGGGTLINTQFYNNRSTNSRAGAYFSNDTTIMSHTTFVSNTSRNDGGAVFALVTLTVTNGLFQDNQCTVGGCDGGALLVFSKAFIRDSQFISNTAQDQGGAVSAGGMLNLTNGLFQNNRSVFGAGGALYSIGSAIMTDAQFISNTSRGNGGGLYAFSTLTITNGLFQDNHSSMGKGGGLTAAGAFHASGTQFLRNVALQGGGLYHNLFDGRVVNSLFVSNIASNTLGSALLLESVDTFEIVHTTVADPGFGSGFAIQVLTGTTRITNTIITSHSVGISNTNGIVNQNYNLFFDNGTNTHGSITGGANSITGDPKFVDPTGDNYHIDVGSAAIDAGTNAGVTIDFDGEIRPQYGNFDIGYDEFTSERTFLPLVMR